MIGYGYAWAYEKYIGDKAYYREIQVKAKTSRVGLWMDENPIAPWQWRRESGESAKYK
jgi:endonuclease YncB( thermonuclease family)